MLQINKVVVAGALGADPETRFMPNGDAVANIRVATTDRWKDAKTGEMREATEWHRVVFYRKLAETVGEHFKKGSPIYLEGKLKTRKWQDKDGKDQYTTEIVADSFQFHGSNKDAASQPASAREAPARAPASSRPAPKPAAAPGTPFDLDNMPTF